MTTGSDNTEVVDDPDKSRFMGLIKLEARFTVG